MKRWLTIWMLAGIAAATCGCGSLSLFSSRHVHYHASQEADKKIDDLAKRVEALERAQRAKAP